MPRIVKLPVKSPRESGGTPRDAPDTNTLRVTTFAEPWERPRRHTSTVVMNVAHMSYNPNQPARTEAARHLNARARRVVGVQRYKGQIGPS